METVTLIGRLLVSLAVVLGLMWVIARRVKRPTRGRTTGLVDVLGRRQLSRTASVAVVRVLDKALIIGVTDGQVSLIGETDLEAAEQAVEVAPPRPRQRKVDLSSKIGPDGRILTEQRPAVRRSALSGSALSPGTWRQAVDSVRTLTARNT
ncbi:MAG TPA: flagellar biosynthetic protein FliO [Jatrophihabitans sp.]|nr:flagellar biosynthetic protein FliO [Jatrophihabitans sp.]